MIFPVDIMSNFLALIQSINYIVLSIIVILRMGEPIFESELKYLNIFFYNLGLKTFLP